MMMIVIFVAGVLSRPWLMVLRMDVLRVMF